MVVTNTLKSAIKTNSLDYIENNANYVAVGDDGTTEQPTDTTLGNEILRKLRQDVTRDDANGKITVSMYIGTQEANNNTLREVGTFDASTGGNMFNRATFTDLNKTSQIEVWIDVEFNVVVS